MSIWDIIDKLNSGLEFDNSKPDTKSISLEHYTKRKNCNGLEFIICKKGIKVGIYYLKDLVYMINSLNILL